MLAHLRQDVLVSLDRDLDHLKNCHKMWDFGHSKGCVRPAEALSRAVSKLEVSNTWVPILKKMLVVDPEGRIEVSALVREWSAIIKKKT